MVYLLFNVMATSFWLKLNNNYSNITSLRRLSDPSYKVQLGSGTGKQLRVRISNKTKRKGHAIYNSLLGQCCQTLLRSEETNSALHSSSPLI
jgi:hypothetical protein